MRGVESIYLGGQSEVKRKVSKMNERVRGKKLKRGMEWKKVETLSRPSRLSSFFIHPRCWGQQHALMPSPTHPTRRRQQSSIFRSSSNLFTFASLSAAAGGGKDLGPDWTTDYAGTEPYVKHTDYEIRV